MAEPTLDQRDRRDILREIRTLAAGYVPEWRWDEENPDAGMALAKVFAEMTEDTVSRYNHILRNHYLSFLNLLGAGLAPPKPAGGMVSVGVLPGVESAFIPKGAALYAAADTVTGRVFYETAEAMEATSAEIEAVFFTSGVRDTIFKAFDREEQEGQPIRLFSGGSQLQAHLLYFREDKVFQFADSGQARLRFLNSLSQKCSRLLPEWLGAPENAVWEHFQDGQWKPVERAEPLADGVQLSFSGGNAPFALTDGTEGRWLRCRLLKLPEGGVRLTSVSCEALGVGLSPDALATDTEGLSIERFCPFGEQLMIFQSFYLCCREAFAKAGSVVEVHFTMDFRKIPIESAPEPAPISYQLIMSDEDFETEKERDVFIERVVWEYWNGRGWARLFPSGEEQDFFTPKKGRDGEQTLRFLCPQDMAPVVMGAAEGPFIRARLDKLSGTVWTRGNCLVPFVHKVSIGYRYDRGPVPLPFMIAESDCERKTVPLPHPGTTPIMTAALCPQPAMYICLNAPLRGGPLRVLFEMEQSRGQKRPALRWEYLGMDGQGKNAWKNLETADGTQSFSRSAIVTLMGKNDFVKTTLFGKSGYFLRLLNADGQYDALSPRRCPVITAVHFNTAPVVQVQRHLPEYFYIGLGETDKRCVLSAPGLRDAEVWVDEHGALSVREEELLLSNPDRAQPERDASGSLTALWVRWDGTEKLRAAGPGDRVYALDYAGGAVQFGDGRHGKIPVRQRGESIRVSYTTCDGELGNIPAGGILGFSAPPPGVSWVTNHKAVAGGAGRETVSEAAGRVTGELLSMGRLVTEEDLERVILASDREIKKVKCRPHLDRFGKNAPGKLAVAVLPREFGRGEESFGRIAQDVRALLRERGPLQLTGTGQVDVFEVRFVEICVSVLAAVAGYDLYHEVYQEIRSRLRAFLNPVSGNFGHGGWEIGRLPAGEQIYNCVKAAPHIKWVKSLHIFPYIVTENGRRAADLNQLAADPFAVPIFGEPDIQLAVEPEKEVFYSST